jgi:hypothetical protein
MLHSTRSRLMSRFARLAAATTLLVFAGACSADSPTMPTTPVAPAGADASLAKAASTTTNPGLVGDLVGAVGDVLKKLLVPAVTRTTPLAADQTVTVSIGSEGGTFTVPGGLKVTVPRGAVSSRITFTATALKGDLVAYEFGPHGIKFAKPLVMEQDLRNTSAGLIGKLTTSLLGLKAGYFADRSSLDYRYKTALVSELLPISLNLNLNTARWEVWHFSGYMVAWD